MHIRWRGLELPSSVTSDPKTLSGTYGKFVAEPFDRSGATRERLILAAEELFARDGLDAVSLRQVNTAAGQRNASAAHYHFGSKQGMVLALFEAWFYKFATRVDMMRVLEANLDFSYRFRPAWWVLAAGCVMAASAWLRKQRAMRLVTTTSPSSFEMRASLAPPDEGLRKIQKAKSSSC